jgi:hypothetical protein
MRQSAGRNVLTGEMYYVAEWVHFLDSWYWGAIAHEVKHTSPYQAISCPTYCGNALTLRGR